MVLQSVWIVLLLAIAPIIPTAGWATSNGGRPRGAWHPMVPVLGVPSWSSSAPSLVVASASSFGQDSVTSALQLFQNGLPTCPESNVLRLAASSGLMGLLAQLILTQFFFRLHSRRRNRLYDDDTRGTEAVVASYHAAGYTAHSLTALVLMGTVSSMGVIGWWCNGLGVSHFSTAAASHARAPLSLASSASARLVQPNDTCRWMAAVLGGMLTVWDIPTSLYIPSLRKLDVLIHHGVMALTAATAAWVVPMPYVYFYFGVVELSSLPLIMYDQLVQWTTTETSDTASSIGADNETNGNDTIMNRQRCLMQWRTAMQVLTVVSFTWIRAILFPKVTLGQFIPDVNSVLRLSPPMAPSPRVIRALQYAKVASIGFTALQLYWFASNILLPTVSTLWKGKVASSDEAEETA